MSGFNEWECGVIVPIQIREDHWVRIGRIPHDLTPAEAERIAAVVRAYASGTLTEGGDAKQAPGESLSGPVAKPDAQGSTP
jgi:hypothetical protein